MTRGKDTFKENKVVDRALKKYSNHEFKNNLKNVYKRFSMLGPLLLKDLVYGLS